MENKEICQAMKGLSCQISSKKGRNKMHPSIKSWGGEFEGEMKLPYVVHFPLIRNLHLWGAKLGQCNLYILV
jgi:hypothetical protein